MCFSTKDHKELAAGSYKSGPESSQQYPLGLTLGKMVWLLRKAQKNRKETGDMAQWLKAIAILREDLGLTPRVHTVAHNHLKLQSQGI